MYRIWSERPIPEMYHPMLVGIAVLHGSAVGHPDDPLTNFPGAHAAIASVRLVYDGVLMDRNPELQVISRIGIGVDNIRIPEATARGIVVCNAPDAPTVSTAEMAITLILALVRDLKRISQVFEQASREQFFETYQGMELQGLVLGVVGLGRIGSHVARVALALGMRVLAYDPFISSERAADLEVTVMSTLENLLNQADIVSLHVPVTPETENLIDATRISQMKPGAILVNTARGALVDENALLDALNRGHLRGAGLDVLRQKPGDIPPDHPLLHRSDVLVTPHIASATVVGKERLWRAAITQALQVCRGERPPHMVNPEVWDRRRR